MSGQTVIVEPGVVMQFADDAGIFVFGSLYIKGTKREPVSLCALDSTWKGLIFHLNNGELFSLPLLQILHHH
ncbi:unnamed protein product [Anisakis simplex]|uniref:Uncharacterized protein n=1 Tax=Anisakis simplex TaxID=6269 RepID=A0A3P6P921_ANISI|nr:unnamed protein product [Anisakis simplex]